MKSDHAARLRTALAKYWPRRQRLPQQRPRRMDRLCRLCWLPQLLLASLTRVHGELTRRARRECITWRDLCQSHCASEAVTRQAGAAGHMLATCWAGCSTAARSKQNRGLVLPIGFFGALYTATFYTAKNTAKNRCIALYTDTRCVTALHSYTALYTIQLYSYTSLYTIQPLQHPSDLYLSISISILTDSSMLLDCRLTDR